MKKDPRMSPLHAREWAKLQNADRDKIIESLKPLPKMEPGDSFQILDGGKYLPLEPGERVPPRRVKPTRPEEPPPPPSETVTP